MNCQYPECDTCGKNMTCLISTGDMTIEEFDELLKNYKEGENKNEQHSS